MWNPELRTSRGAFKTMVLTREQLESLSLPSSGVHPLLQVQAQVEKDRLSSRVSLEAPCKVNRQPPARNRRQHPAVVEPERLGLRWINARISSGAPVRRSM